MARILFKSFASMNQMGECGFTWIATVVLYENGGTRFLKALPQSRLASLHLQAET